MKEERRWMTSVLKEAAKTKLEMPWTRGASRAAAIEKREAADVSKAAKS